MVSYKKKTMKKKQRKGGDDKVGILLNDYKSFKDDWTYLTKLAENGEKYITEKSDVKKINDLVEKIKTYEDKGQIMTELGLISKTIPNFRDYEQRIKDQEIKEETEEKKVQEQNRISKLSTSQITEEARKKIQSPNNGVVKTNNITSKQLEDQQNENEKRLKEDKERVEESEKSKVKVDEKINEALDVSSSSPPRPSDNDAKNRTDSIIATNKVPEAEKDINNSKNQGFLKRDYILQPSQGGKKKRKTKRKSKKASKKTRSRR